MSWCGPNGQWDRDRRRGDLLEGMTPFPSALAQQYRSKGYWEDRPLIDGFYEVFQRYADRVAIIDRDERVTYGELEGRSALLACHLLDLGVCPLDRVVVQLPNAAAFAYLYFALQMIGAIPVLALPVHRRREVDQFVGISGATACAVPATGRNFDFQDMVAALMGEHPTLRTCLVQGAGEERPREGFVSIEALLGQQPWTPRSELEQLRRQIVPTDPAVFLLSGGTTGIPKLIPRTHNDYLYNSRLAASVCDIRDGDVLLIVLPIEHNLPLACPGLQGFLLSGATVVLSTRRQPAEIFQLVERHRVTHVHVVPALLIRWLNDSSAAQHDLSSLHIVQSGGQRLQPEVRQRAQRLLPGCFIQENFGMAEGLIMFVRVDDPDYVRRETCGRPVCPDDEVCLVDEGGREVAAGQVGELIVRGPYTLRGYYRSPEHNSRAFTADGFYRSGDLLRMHPSGNFVVEGRRKDLINRGGEKISAEEVENLALAHPAVLDVSCVPYPDEVLGERMCACVVLKPGASLSLDELVGFLAGFDIAKFKLPERLEILDSLPLSGFGKVSKKALSDLLEDGHG
ncbi:MAG: (2,3-dihydroxybenzoyl)adenylate synthase [Acidimicrobiales bacterium]